MAQQEPGVQDPVYRDIVSALRGDLDHDLFEHSACELLRDEFPGIVPVKGAGDGGVDGAVPDGEGPAYPLVCTTAKDVIGNLTKNLERCLATGQRRKVVVVTSQFLTPTRRRNLERRAEELGFIPVQIVDGTGIADRLRRRRR